MKTFKGSFEACAYRINFWYDVDGLRMTKALKEDLTVAAEERVKYILSQGYVEGQLSFFIPACGQAGDRDVYGGWSIEK